jgi:ABC-type glycerol-3-phosphate transport system permease component
MKDTVLTKKSIGSKVAFGFTFIVFLLYALTIIYTLFWLFTNSLKTIDEWDASKFSLPVEFIKSGLLFDNYIAAWTELNYDGVGVPGMLFNSVWYSVGGAFVAVWFCCLTAYVISKYTFVGRNLIYTVAIIQMVLPIVGNLPATYKMYNDLNITNSPLLLIVNAGGLGGNFMILYATFQGVSNSYMEAAKIDGAGHYSIFFQVMLPQAMPTMFAIFLLGFIGSWNDYMGPLLYLEDYPTLATGLMVFEKDMIYNINMPVFYAGTVILVLPTIVLFAVFSDKMMTSVSIGGLKG